MRGIVESVVEFLMVFTQIVLLGCQKILQEYLLQEYIYLLIEFHLRQHEIPQPSARYLSDTPQQILLLFKDYLCPKTSRIREWFPNLLAGKLRAKALDPYGLMSTKLHGVKNKKDDNYYAITYKCQIEHCHAKFIVHNVMPDSEGMLILVLAT